MVSSFLYNYANNRTFITSFHFLKRSRCTDECLGMEGSVDEVGWHPFPGAVFFWGCVHRGSPPGFDPRLISGNSAGLAIHGSRTHPARSRTCGMPIFGHKKARADGCAGFNKGPRKLKRVRWPR